jgi:hypothetical protein
MSKKINEPRTKAQAAREEGDAVQVTPSELPALE